MEVIILIYGYNYLFVFILNNMEKVIVKICIHSFLEIFQLIQKSTNQSTNKQMNEKETIDTLIINTIKETHRSKITKRQGFPIYFVSNTEVDKVFMNSNKNIISTKEMK